MAGILVIGYYAIGYFGYEVNKDYFSYSKEKCEERIKECSDDLIHQGLDNAKCDINCVDPQLIIKKK